MTFLNLILKQHDIANILSIPLLLVVNISSLCLHGDLFSILHHQCSSLSFEKDAKTDTQNHYVCIKGRFRLIAQFNIELQICFHRLPPHILPTCSVVRAILVFEQWAGGGQNLSNYSNANKARQRTIVKNKTCWTRSRN